MPAKKRKTTKDAKSQPYSKRLPRYLSHQQMLALMEHAPHPAAKTVFMIQYRAGLRVGEATNLRRRDVDLYEGMLTVRQGKGNRDREVPLHPELAERLKQTFEWTDAGKGGKPIVPIVPRTAWKWVRIALLATIEDGDIPEGTFCSTHTLRHSAARHWLNSKVPINQVSVWLGHSNLATTVTVYLPISGAGKEAMALVP